MTTPVIPAVTGTITDGALGLLPPNTGTVPTKVGVSSLGVPNQVYVFNDQPTLVATLGTGPLVKALAEVLARAGGPAIGVPVTKSAGAISAVVLAVNPVNADDETSTGSLAVAGPALDAYDVIVEILQGAADLVANLATFRYSLDGGGAWSPEIAIPTNGVYVVPNTGITLTFTGGADPSFIAGLQWTFKCQAPGYTLNALGAAVAALTALDYDWDHVHVVGSPGPAKSTVVFVEGTPDDGNVALLTVAGSPTAYRRYRFVVNTDGVRQGADQVGAVTSGGTTPPVLAISGPPTPGGAFDGAHLVEIEITTGGALATAAEKHRVDGGAWSTPAVIPLGGVVALGGGLVATFAAGTYNTDNTYSFNTLAAATGHLVINGVAQTTTAIVATGPTDAGVTTAFAAGSYKTGDTWTWDTDSVPLAFAAAVGSALDTLMAAYEAKKRYSFAVIEVPDAPDADIIAAFAGVSFASKRVMVCTGFETLTDAIDLIPVQRSSAWSITSRIAAVRPGEDLGRVKTGSLMGVTAITRDEEKTPALDILGFATLRTIQGRRGQYFITGGRMFLPLTSDFTLVQNRRVMDVACRIVRDGLTEDLNDDVRVDTATGKIFEGDAAALEAPIQEQLEASLLGGKGTPSDNASDVSVQVNRTDNILSTNKLRAKIRVVPKGYLRAIEFDIGFLNPAIQPA